MRNIARKLGVAAMGAMSLVSASSANATLIAHYSFDGALTADSSGNGRTLTNGGGGPSSAAGQFGNAADFAGGAFLFSADSAFDLSTGNFAVSLWYRAAQSSFAPLVGKNASTSNIGWAVTQSTDIAGDLGDTLDGLVTTTAPADDETEFHHLVFQKNGSDLELWLDSVLVSTDSGAVGSNTSNAFAIGTRNISAGGSENSGGGSQKFNGLMDEIYIFDNVLTQTEISNLNQFNSLESVSISAPGSWTLFGLGLFGLGYVRRRRI